MRRTLALWLLLLGVYAAAAGLEDGYAVVAALALALAYRLALRVVPDPWAIGAAAALGLSPPLLAYDTAHTAELGAGAALAGAALLAVRLDTRPGWRNAFGCFALLGALPWLGIEFVPAGVVIGALAARTLWRARKRTLAVGAVELSLFSVAVFVGVNEALYESPVPDDALDSSDIELAPLAAPLLALVFVGLWWLWRSHSEQLARAVPQQREVELCAGICACVIGVQALVALSAPQYLLAALPPAVPLVAWGLRHAPRTGTVLAVLTLLASAWFLAG